MRSIISGIRSGPTFVLKDSLLRESNISVIESAQYEKSIKLLLKDELCK